MSPKNNFRDSLRRLAQLGQATGLQLVRIKEQDDGNRYTADAIEFDADDDTQLVDDSQLTVVNLAEPADEDGQLPAGTNAVAVDVEGEWVVLVRPTGTFLFAAQILYTFGNALYRVRPQVPVEENTFTTKSGGQDINACNLAELHLAETLGLDADIIVLVAALTTEGDPPTIRYVFDHPVHDEYH